MEARRGLGRPDEALEVGEEALEAVAHGLRGEASLCGHAELRHEALLPVEGRPVVARIVLLREAADEVVVVEAEARRAEAVERREAAAEGGVEARAARAGLDPFEHEEGRPLALGLGDREHLRHREGARLVEPPKATGLGREHGARRPRVRLDEDAPAVVELCGVGLVDVAAREPTHRGDAA